MKIIRYCFKDHGRKCHFFVRTAANFERQKATVSTHFGHTGGTCQIFSQAMMMSIRQETERATCAQALEHCPVAFSLFRPGHVYPLAV